MVLVHAYNAPWQRARRLPVRRVEDDLRYAPVENPIILASHGQLEHRLRTAAGGVEDHALRRLPNVAVVDAYPRRVLRRCARARP